MKNTWDYPVQNIVAYFQTPLEVIKKFLWLNKIFIIIIYESFLWIF